MVGPLFADMTQKYNLNKRIYLSEEHCGFREDEVNGEKSVGEE